MKISLEGQTAIVTGGARGIGRSYCESLAAAGASVVVADLSQDHATETVDLIKGAGGKAAFVKTDVASTAGTLAMAAFAVETFGGVDILVNNAGMFAGLPSEGMLGASEERWDQVMAVNLKGPWLCARAAAPHMIRRGGGAIVNQTSTAAYINTPNRMNYNVSKGGLVPMTKTMARELGVHNIRVNAIAPGPVATEALKGVPQEALDRIKAAQCIPRLGAPEDLAGAMLFLVSPMSAWMSGQVLVVDGGNQMPG